MTNPPERVASVARPMILAAIALPVLIALAFVARFSTELPLTDEWVYVQSVMDLQDMDRSEPGWFSRSVDAAALTHNGHVMALPFVIYWLLSPLVGFDQRLFVLMTMAAFLLQVELFRRWIGGWSLAVFPISLAIFGLGHYMEFLWGFEFTLAFSTTLPMVGLAVIDAIAPAESMAGRWRKLVLGLVLIFLGTISSFGGWFGFASGALLIALKPLELRSKAALVCATILVGAVIFPWLLPETGGERTLGMAQVFHVLTAIGGMLFGTPVGLFEFGVDFRSVTGALILLALIVAVLQAARARMLGKIALPLSFSVFGFLCLLSVAVGRDYLGNWHLQHGLPLAGGAFACAYGVWREHRGALAARVPFFALTAALLASSCGTVRAFLKYGPEYRAYIGQIEDYAVGFLRDPALPMPAPGAPELTADLLLFLAAYGQPIFHREPLPDARVAAEGERVFMDGEELLPPRRLGPSQKRRRITVFLPKQAGAKGALLEVGSFTLRLHRLHPGLVPITGSDAAACFGGVLLPGLPRSEESLRIQVAKDPAQQALRTSRATSKAKRG